MLRAAFIIAFSLTNAAMAADIMEGPPHWPTREYVARDAVGVVGPGQIMMLGDSNTEMFWWNQIDGKFVLNAGEAGALLEQVVNAAHNLIPVAKPHVVTVMVGTNDCRIGMPTDPVAWGEKYAALLDFIHTSGAVPVVLTILPVEQSGPLGASYFDTACIAALNNQINNLAVERGEVYVNLNYTFAIPPAYKYMHQGWTMDGAHLYGPSSRALFYVIEPAIEAAWSHTP